MNNDWKEKEKIFHEALALTGVERGSFLNRACSGNDWQISEIDSLIKAFESDSGFLEEPVFNLALGIFGGTTSQITPGSWIGPYQIVKKIGEGGMGEVYDAFDNKLNRRVALKFISEWVSDNNAARRLLIKEAQAAALLEHDNICTVYTIEHTEKHHFIVMQYIEGFTLAELIKEAPPGQDRLLSIAGQIISAVEFAHSHDIIHRDLKPANIMVKSDGQVKVLDFGLAKTVQTTAGQTNNSASAASENGLIIGTVAYMSPEQLRGDKLDFQSDIFSLGIILYELMTGKNPFARNSQAETIAAILNESPPAAGDLKPAAPGNLAAVTRKCLQKDKALRYSSMAEISTEFHRPQERRNYSGLVFKAVLAIALMLALFLAGSFYMRDLRKPSFAVLPISNQSGDLNNQYLADGLTEELIDNLSLVSGLDIKKESDAGRTKYLADNRPDPQAAGRELNADAVLTGAVGQRDGAFFIAIDIIKTADGTVLDTTEYPLKDFDIVSIRENISRRVADKLQFRLTEKEKNNLARRTTQNPDVLNLYFMGRYHWNRRNKDDLKMAIKYFNQAADLEPSFVRAWTGLADVYLYYSVPGRSGTMSPQEAVNLAKAALANAMELNSNSAELSTSLGRLKQRFDWDWPGAEQDFRAAISLQPDFAPAHQELSKVLMTTGRLDEALAEAEKTRELDPLNVSTSLNLGRIYYFKRDYEKAERIFLDVFDKNPDKTRSLFLLGYLYTVTGKLKEATDSFEKIYRQDPLLGAAGLGYCYGKTGQKDKAREILSELEKHGQQEYVPSQEKALIYLGLGETDKVFENLDATCKEKFAAFPGLISDQLLDEIRSDPRFSSLRQCAHL